MKTRNLSLSDNEDRISDLPDILLHHIFSFIDIKYAIEASVLSRRWRYLWKSLPTLNIDDGLYFWRAEEEEFNTVQVDPGVQFSTEEVDPRVELTIEEVDPWEEFIIEEVNPVDPWEEFIIEEFNPEEESTIGEVDPMVEFTIEEVDGFVYFVDRVLGLRERSDIQRFNLACNMVGTGIMDVHIHKWILAAVRYNVQELCFSRSIFNCTFEIPHCLFSCKSLTKLELEISMVTDGEYKVVLPNLMSLPRLKYLKISSLPFVDERLTNMLFSSCPVLESLIFERCGFHNVNLNISSPKLEHFSLSCYEGSDTKVELYAPNLRSFNCKDFMSKDYSLENLSSLVTADIYLSVQIRDKVPETYELLTEKKELYAQRMVKFLRALHNVKVLALSPWILQVVSSAPEILDSQPTQFFNLQHLKLRTFLSRDCMDSIIYLLNNSPNIESLSLLIDHKKQFDGPPMYPFCDEIIFNSGNTEDYWEAGWISPCVLYHLNFVEIRDLLGCVNELKFLEILLKNAMVLEKVVLFSRPYMIDPRDKERRMMTFHDKLLSFPRASASMTILLDSSTCSSIRKRTRKE